MTNRKTLLLMFSLVFLVTSALAGCGGMTVLRPDQLRAPSPIQGTSGKYVCPFNHENGTCAWTDKVIKARMGVAVGSYAGDKILEKVPLVGDSLGKKAGKTVGRMIALEACGGWEVVKATGDHSFGLVNDYAVHLYVVHSANGQYEYALEAAMAVYPNLKEKYQKSLVLASKQQRE